MKKGINYIGVSVGAMIFNQKDQVFLSKRSQNSHNEKGCWEAPGGSVDFGEKLEDAIKREIMEEYGIEIEIVRQLPAHNHILPKEKQHWVASCFVCKYAGKKKPRIMEPDKCDEIGWFDLDNLPKPLSLATKMDLEKYDN
jgi:8-oxo-dGTP diphosphatase